MTEQQPYTVMRTLDQFEVRSYPAHMLVQVNVRGARGGGPQVRGLCARCAFY
jgi:hypothetical protein